MERDYLFDVAQHGCTIPKDLTILKWAYPKLYSFAKHKRHLPYDSGRY